jgi:hypothetical protein
VVRLIDSNPEATSYRNLIPPYAEINRHTQPMCKEEWNNELSISSFMVMHCGVPHLAPSTPGDIEKGVGIDGLLKLKKTDDHEFRVCCFFTLHPVWCPKDRLYNRKSQHTVASLLFDTLCDYKEGSDEYELTLDLLKRRLNEWPVGDDLCYPFSNNDSELLKSVGNVITSYREVSMPEDEFVSTIGQLVTKLQSIWRREKIEAADKIVTEADLGETIAERVSRTRSAVAK